ncbi:MAG TPA: sterol desaturase family protein [Actinoplanes sp.]|nr:sterol desaturase family protein [Actinoplanes sp.]
MAIRDLLVSMPLWAYFLVAPFFVVINLLLAAGIVNALKRRTPVIQQNPPASAKTKNVGRTLALNYTLLSGFAGATLYFMAHSSSVSWTKISLTNTLLAIVLVMLGNDVLYYAYHRLMHTDFFWYRLHYIHHEAVSPGGLRDTFYEHPVDFFVGTLCVTLPLLVVPIKHRGGGDLSVPADVPRRGLPLGPRDPRSGDLHRAAPRRPPPLLPR